MIAVIIPSHNQSNHIQNIIKSYEKQIVIPDILLFVFDRCTDDSVNILQTIDTKLNIKFIEKLDGENFSAGMTRDAGISYIEQFSPDVVIFTDGDCYPNETVVEDHYNNCITRSTPIVSCGRRMMQTENDIYEEDERMQTWAQGCSFVNSDRRVLLSTRVTLDSIFTYSCNLAFNWEAIKLCKRINKELTGISRVFNSEFDGTWGGEDNFVSNCLFRTGNYILMANYRSCVYHPWHVPNKYSPNNKNTWKKLDYSLYLSILFGTIEGPVTTVERNRSVVEPLRFSGVINNIHEVKCNSTAFNDLVDVYFFSRNFKISKPMIERPRKLLYEEKELIEKYDFSAFRKFYLTSTSIEENTDIEKYDFNRDRQNSNCSYCRLSK